MNKIVSTLETLADLNYRPFEEVLTYHFLEGVLRRVASSRYSSELVLRGGLLTRLWVPVGHRIAADVDFLGLFPFAIAATEQRFREILSADNIDDGIIFNLDALEVKGIWLNTDFPGVRLRVPVSIEQYQQQIQIDVGFDDPLVPPAEWIDYPMSVAPTPVKLQAVRPETMAAWKLHGLIEQGAKCWRPKDLYDLMLLATVVSLQESLLPEAIQVAFSSRNANFQEIRQILTNSHWWNTGKNRRKWRWYCRQVSTQIMPDNLLSVVTLVIDYWAFVIKDLCDTEGEG